MVFSAALAFRRVRNGPGVASRENSASSALYFLIMQGGEETLEAACARLRSTLTRADQA